MAFKKYQQAQGLPFTTIQVAECIRCGVVEANMLHTSYSYVDRPLIRMAVLPFCRDCRFNRHKEMY